MGERLSGAIIAAGRGDRLREAVGGVPKPLVELMGEPLIVRQIRAMAAIGATPVHVVINSETAAHIDRKGIELPEDTQLIVRDTPSSMESLLTLGETIPPGRFLLATVDSVVDRHEFRSLAKQALEITEPGNFDRFDGVLGVVRWRGDKHPLFAEVAPDRRISSLGARQTDIVTAGVYLFSTRIFDLAEETRAAGLDALRRFLAFLIDHGMRLAAIEMREVIDVDEGPDLEAARTILARSHD